MLIVLLAIIGAKIGAGIAYWICFSIYCILRLTKVIYEVTKDD